MKKFLFLIIFIQTFSQVRVNAQFSEPKYTPGDPSIPAWVKLMYAENPNVYRVDSAYQSYYKNNIFKETSYTRQYMRWRTAVGRFVDEQGYVNYPSPAAHLRTEKELADARAKHRDNRSSLWDFAGPEVHYTARYSAGDTTMPRSEQANTYCIDQSVTNPDILYCGTECGGLYKSTDKGANWHLVSRDLLVYDANAVAINPSNENEVVFGAAGLIYKTTDGGDTWHACGSAAFQSANLHSWQIEYNPANPLIIYAATDKGFFRTTDGGTNWTQVLSNECMSLAIKPNDPSVIYALQYDPSAKIPKFYKSVNQGQSFTVKPNGWFTVPAGDQGLIQSQGGRIAVTKANPNRVYVLLVGLSDAAANLQLGGYIGVYSSSNAGESWTLPQGLIGMPYDLETHPNLMDFDGHTSDYCQIYYNTALIVSQLDEDRLLIGGLNLWRSDDGATTYQPVGGYIGSIPYLHVDIQEMKVYKTSATTEEVWIASDGGVNYSTDFVNTHDSRCNGLLAGAFWGFDQGWNEDIMVGGRYHNGNAGYYENYPAGTFLSLGGGEAPTGYVNYSDERKTYFSDIDGKILPQELDGVVTSFGMYNDPNESYWENSSSRIVFDWRYWNVAYMGRDNTLFKSTDGGGSFSPLYTFTTNPNNKVLWIEQSFSNPDIIYVQVVIGGISKLGRSDDGGVTWTMVTLPSSKREMVFTLSYTNPDELWVAFTYGGDGQKIYHTLDGGTNWTNMTTSALNTIRIKAIAHQAGTDGMVYIAALNGLAFYRDNAMPDWMPMTDSLPLGIDPLRLVPFYRDGKLRLATWNMAVWETSLKATSPLMANFSANYESFYCPGDTLHFVNHSVCTGNATCQWYFPGGTPATSTDYNPKVTYAQSGDFDVTLVVTDGGITDSITRTGFIRAIGAGSLPLAEGFEAGFLEPDWRLYDDGNDGTNWAITTLAGGYGTSSYSLIFDNFSFDVQGKKNEVWTQKLDFTNIVGAKVLFDVAYSEYGGQYSDTLALLVTKDCGATFSEIYRKGGQELATAPNFTASVFIPTSAEWRTDEAEIGGLEGYPEVTVAFQNRGHWGQAIYIDNVRVEATHLTGTWEQNGEEDLIVKPNPNDGRFSIVFNNFCNGSCLLAMVNVEGKKVFEKTVRIYQRTFSEDFDLSGLKPGIYLLKATTHDRSITKKVVILNTK
jgi:photosystem II stability/assembly factor-like uncharacterized protein